MIPHHYQAVKTSSPETYSHPPVTIPAAVLLLKLDRNHPVTQKYRLMLSALTYRTKPPLNVTVSKRMTARLPVILIVLIYVKNLKLTPRVRLRLTGEGGKKGKKIKRTCISIQRLLRELLKYK